MKAITQNGTTITLNDSAEIHRGGEGRILLVKELPNQVAKLYLDPNRTFTPDEIKALQPLPDQFFVKPTELIFDKKTKQVLGFTMPYLGTDYVQLAAFFSLQFCARRQTSEADKFLLIKHLAQATKAAHQHQILIGDFSGLNVLVSPTYEIKFIDVDGYGTPVRPHSQIMLDEIRDHLYGGQVSLESDYFALSILAFNLLTHTPPFKGVHKTLKSLAERMIYKVPVFAPDPDLIKPKCFVSIKIPALQTQFEDIFMKGNRFLIQTDQQPVQAQPLQKMQTPSVQKTDLLIKPIFELTQGEQTRESFALSNRLLVKTNQRYLVFDCSNYGYTVLKHEFSLKEADQVWIGEKEVLAKKGMELWVLRNQNDWERLNNFQFKKESQWTQYKNILAVVEDEFLKMLYLDETNKDFVRIEQTPVFGKGFQIRSGALWQQVGGQQYFFYHSGKTLSTVLSPLPIQDLKMLDNQLLMAYRNYNSNKETAILYAYGTVQNLQSKMQTPIDFENLKHFAYKANNTQHGLIFEPADDRIVVRRTEDFAVLQEIDCKIISDFTELSNTQAGIVAIQPDYCVLLNKK